MPVVKTGQLRRCHKGLEKPWRHVVAMRNPDDKCF